MSQFLGTTSGTAGLGVQCCPNDIRLMPTFMIDYDPFIDVRIGAAWDLFMGFETPWWPRGGSLMQGGDGSNNDILEAAWDGGTELIEPKGGGSNSRFGIYGITRDVYGTPLGDVTCKLFRTIGDLYKDVMIDETVSDPSGNYFLSTPFYPETHYVVTYKVGTPDTFGSSPNNLQGS
jgi:hypothetical protein